MKFTPIEGTGIAIDAHGLLNPINAVEMARRIGRYAFRDLLVHEAVNVIHKIAAMAEAFYVSLAPHNPWSPLSTAISLHLDPVIPNFLIQEIPTAGAHADRARLLQQQIESPNEGYLDIPSVAWRAADRAADLLPDIGQYMSNSFTWYRFWARPSSQI